MKMSSIMQKEKITAIPLCSIKSHAVWMWAISGWNLKAATSRQARLERNR